MTMTKSMEYFTDSVEFVRVMAVVESSKDSPLLRCLSKALRMVSLTPFGSFYTESP